MNIDNFYRINLFDLVKFSSDIISEINKIKYNIIINGKFSEINKKFIYSIEVSHIYVNEKTQKFYLIKFYLDKLGFTEEEIYLYSTIYEAIDKINELGLESIESNIFDSINNINSLIEISKYIIHDVDELSDKIFSVDCNISKNLVDININQRWPLDEYGIFTFSENEDIDDYLGEGMYNKIKNIVKSYYEESMYVYVNYSYLEDI